MYGTHSKKSEWQHIDYFSLLMYYVVSSVIVVNDHR